MPQLIVHRHPWELAMNRIGIVAALTASVLFAVVSNDGAFGQSAKDVVGTYTSVAVSNSQGDKIVEPYSSKPKGMMRLDASGRYMVVLMRPDLQKFASNSRTNGTFEEYKAIALGSFVHMGTYSVEDGHIVFRLENTTFPNWDGDVQKRKLTVAGDELKYEVGSTLGGTSVVVWKRIH